MLSIKRSNERGYTNQGWLESYHSFSFGGYHDQTHMGFSVLRVLNEDIIAGGRGFDMHDHKDMEIVTYMIDGQLQHQDSMSNNSVLSRGDVQRMTAGKGIRHSEFNHETKHPVHLLQIWIRPNNKDLTPSYEEKYFSDEVKNNQWCLIVSPKQRPDALFIHQDVYLYATKLDQAKHLPYELAVKRCVFLQVVKGKVNFEGQVLDQGDSATFSTSDSMKMIDELSLLAVEQAEVLLFDLPILE